MPATTAKSSRRRRPAKRPVSRAAIIDAICGKYRHVPTSSRKFAAQKRREIEREDRSR